MKIGLEDDLIDEIRNKDLAIKKRDIKIEEQEKKLSEKDTKLAKKEEKLLETAKLLKQLNVDIETIISKTGLSRKEIENI